MNDDNKFFEILVSRNIVPEEELEHLKNVYYEDPGQVLLHLKKEFKLDKELLGRAWGDALYCSYVNLDKTLFQEDVVSMLDEESAKKYSAIPLYKGNAVTVATSNITNELILKEVEKIIGEPISPVFAFSDEIKEQISLQYRTTEKLLELSNNIINNPKLQNKDIVTAEELEQVAGDRLIVNFTDELMLWAIKERASDIHIEPDDAKIRIRYRVDGMLQEKINLDKSVLQAIVTRIKVLANVDIVEKRRPQDGRISYKFFDRNVDIRFSIIPTVYGEKIVLRILGHSIGKDIPDLKELQFSKPVYDSISKIINSPNGIFFVTGPTGSGKTTTLFSILKELNKPEVNITTIEDPVEFKLNGLNQVQTNEAVGLNFAKALRAFLRQDPDVILIGEIRDMETAKIAAQAALTGHLVLATMHTNSSIQAVTRLIEIGVEPFLVAPSIIGVMAQRLVRKICDNCKEKYLLTKDEKEKYFTGDLDQDIYFYKGSGCMNCNKTGYKGRVAIHEIYILDEEARNMIVKDVPILEIQKHAEDKGFKSMRYDGLKKVLRGMTTIDELERVTVEQEV